jgi:amino acid adenylation domain-containing protein
VLLTHSGLEARLPETPGLTRLLLDAERQSINAESSTPLRDVAIDPDYAAYVIYTSGSTGRPKGVVVTHANVSRLLTAAQDRFAFGPADVWTLFHSYAFDFSVWEIWGALAWGGRLVIVPYWVSRSPEALLDLLESEQVTVLNQTPSAFRQLDAAEAERPRHLSLRTIVFGGEALDPAALTSWFDRRGDREPLLVNMYGITETTVHVTYRPMSRADLGAGSRIGLPIPDLQIYVLDRRFEPVPLLVPGEIHVGGAGVARGYLHRPELTAERFVANPFSPEPGARLYRSGDLARRRPDGELEYLGRIDHQVKLRGIRIELGEIESALLRHPAVREAAVAIREDGPSGQKRLVAYVVPHAGATFSLDALRQFIGEQLPEAMLPSAWVRLDALPLSSNGKMDRRLLPAPDPSRPELTQEFVPPQSPLESALAEILEQILGLDRIGVLDNFFTLGGDSILSIQVVSQARARGIELTVQQIFLHQTVQELARVASLPIAGAIPAARVESFDLISGEDRSRLPEGIEDAYPLAQLQAGILFHSELSAASAVYNNTVSLRITAALDLDSFRLALLRLASRHPLLRTSFHLSGFSEPLQLVHRDACIPLEVDDLQGLSADEQEAEIERWFDQERRRHFDWQTPPLLRFHIHVCGADDFQLSWSEHHAILDGWSVAAMTTELSQDYFALRRHDEAAEEPAAPASLYRDFVAQERRTLALEEARRFWLDELRDANVLQLPQTRGSEGAERIRAVTSWVPPEVTEGVKRLARTAGIPLKSVLLAAHARVLHLLTGQSDLLTGVVANGRLEEPDGERVLGLFLNSLPFRLKLEGGSWSDLARLAFVAERRTLPYRRFPLAELQRLTGGRPLFEVAFTYLHYHVMQSFSALGEQVRIRGTRSDIPTNFTLSSYFLLDPFTANLSLALDYDASRLDPEQAQRILGYYGRALASLAELPEAPFLDACLLVETEQEQLLREWNPTGSDAADNACLHELFAVRAATIPDAVAVVFEERRLTYRELDERSNQLARHLLRHGVRPESRVGIYLDRSIDLVVAILGVLKAGGAYVPLDPTYPEERLSWILEDSLGASGVLVTRDGLADLSAAVGGLKKVRLDAEAQDIARESAENLPGGLFSSHPAYVIYTSGSTGRPKGVVVTHTNAVRLFTATNAWFEFGERDAWTLFHSYAFDFSVWELWGALLFGGRLVVVPHWVSRSPDAFYDLIAQQGITVLNQTPSAFQQLSQAEERVSEANRHQLALRFVIFGGELLDLSILEPWLRRHGDTYPQLVNMYGITETTVHVTWRPISSADLLEPHHSPIGCRIPDLQVHLLDARGHLVPVGVPGEIQVGGPGLARGYLNLPELTAERFVPNPFGAPGTRLYRTGDLARRRPNSELDFLGRIDHQVKIRGFRVELGELEAVLRRLPGVRDTAVILREDRLLAYVVPDTERLEAERSKDELGSAQVAEWRMVFDRTYESGRGAGSPELDLSGWISSYTGEPIPEAEMREWVDSTVERIRSLEPQSILEIGCGTGLLLSRLAPSCSRYWATDISEAALGALRPRWEGRTESDVRLLLRAADDFEGIPERTFDLVILNSVVQYFPSVDYLLRVIERAVQSLRDGGHLFLGDLRSLPLHRPFYSSVEVFRAPASLPLEQVRRRVTSRMTEDGELLLASSLFPALARRIPRLGGVRPLLKRGRVRNEMNKFRYDAVLRVGPLPDDGLPAPRRPDRRAHAPTMDGLRQILEDERPASLALTGLQDARLSQDLRIAELLWSLDPAVTAGDLRRAASDAHDAAVEPEHLCALAEASGYMVDLVWPGFRDGESEDGTFEALLRPAGTPPRWIPLATNEQDGDPHWSDHVNNPLKSRFFSWLVPQLRRDLQRTLPEYMIPSAFVLLDALPLSHNGKLDRQSLPVPDPEVIHRTRVYVAPRTPIEETLAEIWGTVLKLNQVGVEDNLFEIGGHSLLATQIVVRIRETFQINLSLRTLYDAPTISALAVAVVTAKAAKADSDLLAELLTAVEGMPLESIEAMLGRLPLEGRS